MNNNLVKLNTNAELIKAHLDKDFFKKKKENNTLSPTNH